MTDTARPPRIFLYTHCHVLILFVVAGVLLFPLKNWCSYFCLLFVCSGTLVFFFLSCLCRMG